MNNPNEQEVTFRKEFNEIVRQASSMESFKPTYEDIVRFHSQATRLLLKIGYYSLPMELQITGVADGGRYFSYLVQNPSGVGVNTQWVATGDVEVLMMFPPQELTKRIKEINTSKLESKVLPKSPLDQLVQYQIKKVGGKYRVFEYGEDWKITFPNLKTARAAIERHRASRNWI